MIMGLGHVEAIAAFTAVAAVVLAVAVTLGTSKRQRRLPARIILVRHGESKGNATTATKEEYRRTQDHLIELTELGQQQALEAGERLAQILHPSSGSATRAKFFVSPYARCRHTLDAILSAVPPEARVGEVTVDNLLREFDRGYHGQTHDDVMAWNLARREYGMCQYRFQNGESLEDVYARASTWVALFHSFLDLGWVGCDDTVVIVCHAGLMLQVAKRLLGQPVEGFKPTTLPNCAFFVFERYTVSTDGRADSSSVACYAPDPATHDILEWLPRKSDGTLTTAGEATEAAHRIVRSMSPGPLVFPL